MEPPQWLWFLYCTLVWGISLLLFLAFLVLLWLVLVGLGSLPYPGEIKPSTRPYEQRGNGESLPI